MHVPFDEIVDGWQKREMPLLLLQANRRLSGIFGAYYAAETTSYLEMLLEHVESVFRLRDTFFPFADVLEQGQCVEIRGIRINAVVTASTAAAALERARWPARADRAYRRHWMQGARATGATLQADFLEYNVGGILDVAEYRIRKHFSLTVGSPVSAVAAKVAREILLFEIWCCLKDQDDPLMQKTRELRKAGALPLLMESGAMTLLVCEPEIETPP